MAKKRGLGKGLDALFAEPIEEQIDVNSHSLIEVDIHQIKPNALQPRKSFDSVSLEALSDSIKNNGILQPLVLRVVKDGYEIIAGERRFRAAKLAGLKSIPAIIMDPSEQKLYELALIENMQRVDLNPIEEGLAFRTLIDSYNMKQDEVAKVVGKSRTYVTNTMRLLSLMDKVKNYVAVGDITAGHAKVLVGLSQDKQLQLANLVIKDQLSVRELEKRVKLMKAPQIKKRNHTQQDNRYYQPYLHQLEDVFGTKVDIEFKNQKNKISIEFYSEKDFERIFDIIKGK